ncbi:hypothetical protein R3P38DRAFT_3058457, partial [Favolaschia claudopus]
MSRAALAAELRDHINELASAIEAQSVILRGLVTQHKEGQRKLNSLVDPLARLPLELQSEIFMLCLTTAAYPEDRYSNRDTRQAPNVFLGVSQLWRDVALATPRLWAALRVAQLQFSCYFHDFCALWMQRAKHIPVSLTLYGRLQPGLGDAAELLHAYGPQLRELTLQLGMPPEDEFESGYDLEFDAAFPLLKTLDIQFWTYEPTIRDATDWIAFLRAAPALLQCSFQNGFYIPEDDVEVESLTHTSLQRLYLGHADDRKNGNSAGVLRYLTLPALQELQLTRFDLMDEQIIDFFVRSAPPLESLRLIPPSDWYDQPILECFKLIPSLERLTLDHGYPLAILQVLNTFPDILPNLRHFTLVCGLPKRREYDAVIKILGVRPLKSFRFYQEIAVLYGEDVMGPLREFAKNGVDMHVGLEGHNLV